MEIRKKDRKVAYFSMEIGLEPNMPTYAGGLGILAGDTLKTCADLNVPVVAVSLLYRDGYFKQHLDSDGNQTESPDRWDYDNKLELLPEKVVVSISGRDVVIQAWQYTVKGFTEFEVPVLFLDTNLPENTDQDRIITQKLYQGDHSMRISQEIVLGIGGLKMLQDLGYKNIKKHHLNEGHGSFLILELLSDTRLHHGKSDLRELYDFEEVKHSCVFTTHTPVAAGHDQFDPQLVKDIIGKNINSELLDYSVKNGKINMTQIALANSEYVNGVAKKHAFVSKQMFPEHKIASITNGIYCPFWVHPGMQELFDKYIPKWFLDPTDLRHAMIIPDKELWNAHIKAKKDLIDFVNTKYNSNLSPDVFTIGFARRAAEYKRVELLFSDIKKLKSIVKKVGKIQIVLAGKAHPQDGGGKGLIKRVFEKIKELKGLIEIVYLENYNIEIAQKMVPGVDIWLNTPLKPREASGTSGMKAALNGVPQFSILDGWWIEGCIEGLTGWSIGTNEKESNWDEDAKDLYDKLEKEILPIFYNKKSEWRKIMKYSISFNASYFNTHRMVKDYVLNAYFIESE